jgi:SAM-dependent methyltransferase
MNQTPESEIKAAHPWGDATLARLYDAFPFSDDIPLYMELAKAQGGNVLEVACGTGRVLVPLAQAGNQVTGIDASPYMLDIAREKLASAGPEAESHARLVQADMRSFDLGEQFDLAIIAVKSIAYLTSRTDQQRTLERVAAHLRHAGLLAIDLMNPSPEWLMGPPGSLRQDLVQTVQGKGITVARTEAVVSTDLAEQVRIIRSAYEIVREDGTVTKHFVEWPYRYVYRFEAELLLESVGLRVEAVYGGYRRESFTSESKTMLFLARRS